MKHMSGGHGHDGKKLSFMQGVYVNVISTAHGLAPSIIVCSLQPRHGSVLGQLERKTSEGDRDQYPGQWCIPSWIWPQSDSPHSSGRLNLGALVVVFYIIIVVGVVVFGEGGGFSPGSENHSQIMRAGRHGVEFETVLVVCIAIRKQRLHKHHLSRRKQRNVRVLIKL